MKKLGKISLYFFGSLVAIVLALNLYIFLNKDKIIARFVKAVNQQINTEIKVGKIDITIWQDFPNVSLIFENVRVSGTIKTQQRPLFYAKNLSFEFNIVDFIYQNYKISQLSAKDGVVFIFITKSGENNYNISSKAESTESEFSFDIKKITLKNIDLTYQDEQLNQFYVVKKLNGKGKLKQTGNTIKTEIEADLLAETITIEGETYFKNKPLTLNGSYIHNTETSVGVLKPTEIRLFNSVFYAHGEFQPKKERYFVEVKNDNADIQTLLSLMPNSFSNSLKKYKSEGKVYFHSKILKNTEYNFPSITVDFGLEKAKVYEPTTGFQISSLSLKGNFNNGNRQSNKTSTLSLKGIKGNIDNKAFAGEFLLTNFENPFIDTKFKGSIEVLSLAKIINTASTKWNSGDIDFNIALQAPLASLTAVEGKNIVSSGDIKAQNIQIQYNEHPISVATMDLMFNNSSIDISRGELALGGSDFQFLGNIKNPFFFMDKDQKELIVEITNKSKLIRSDTLLAIFHSIGSGTTAEDTSEALKLNLSVNTEADLLTYDQFELKNFTGKLNFYENTLLIPHVSFTEFGGLIEVKSEFETQKDKTMGTILLSAKDINIKTIFTKFKNFEQEFITKDNLEGHLSTNLKTTFTLNEDFEVDLPSLLVEAACEINNGKLIDFEPMQKLSVFIKREELANISFSKIQNTIKIQNQVITIPEMDINSSVSNIVVAGTHTLDQKIDYRLKIPLNNFISPDKDEAFGAVEDNGSRTIVHLKITGTTDDYKIAYDKKATTNKIKTNINEEIKEFKDLISGKIKEDTVKQVQLTEEEFFDF